MNNKSSYVELTFEEGNVVIRLAVNKNVRVTKKGSIIIENKKFKSKEK